MSDVICAGPVSSGNYGPDDHIFWLLHVDADLLKRVKAAQKVVVDTEGAYGLSIWGHGSLSVYNAIPSRDGLDVLIAEDFPELPKDYKLLPTGDIELEFEVAGDDESGSAPDGVRIDIELIHITSDSIYASWSPKHGDQRCETFEIAIDTLEELIHAT